MNLPTLDFSEILPALIAAVPSVLVIITAAIILNILIGRGLRILAYRTSFTEQEILPIRRALKRIIFIGAAVFVFGSFGLNVGGMWGVLSTILAMLAIGFVAVWSVLSNTLCTLIIMLFRPFAVGDHVEFAGEPVQGRVVDLNLIYTTLDAGDGTVMQVPNNHFFQKVLRRRHASRGVSPGAHMRTKNPSDATTAPEAAAANTKPLFPAS